MLIKALSDYYDMLAADGKVLPEGYSNVNIHYMVLLNKDGEIVDIEDRQLKEHKLLKNGKSKEVIVPRRVEMPKRSEKTGIDANIIEHRPIYLFGLNFEDGKLLTEDRTDRAKKSHEAFVKTNLEFLEGMDEPVINAYRKFIEKWDPAKETENINLLSLGKKYETARFIFCLSDEPDKPLHENREIKKRWETWYKENKADAEDNMVSQCAVSGKVSSIARIHSKIKGVYGCLSSGSVLVGFNNPSENSYGNEQSYNSNISESVMLKYTEALNIILSDNKHKILMDDMTIVFWAMETSGKCEGLLESILIGSADKMDADNTEKMLRSLLIDSVEGKVSVKQLEGMEDIDENVDFYVVGIKPNSSRLSIKFINKSKYANILWNVAKFQQDMQISEETGLISLKRIKGELRSPKSISENINPALMINLLEAIINGDKLPRMLLQTVIKRVKTDTDIEINRVRAGIVKSCINRNDKEEVLKVTLDKDNKDQAYLCGRLFATLEMLQNEAFGGSLNATIKNKYFASAASKPALIFPKLIQLAQHHLNKLTKERRKIFYNRLMGGIIEEIQNEFPETVTLQDQGKFIIGYYHQRQDLFKKQEGSDTEEM